MKNLWLLTKHRLKARNQLLLSSTLLLIILWAAANQTAMRFWRNTWLGPLDISSDFLEEIKDVNKIDRYWVRINGEKSVDLGIVNVEVTSKLGIEISRRTNHLYFATKIGNRWLIVGDDKIKTNILGVLGKSSHEVNQLVFSTPQMRKLEPLFYPFLLENKNLRVTGYFYAFLVTSLVALIIFFWGRSLIVYINPASLYAVNKDDLTISEISILAKNELEANPIIQRNSWRATESFFASETPLSFHLERWHDLLWVHKQVVNKYYYFIPSGKDEFLVLHFSNYSFTVRADDSIANEIIKLAYSKSPWAAFGFTNDLKKLFSSQKKLFVSSIIERRSYFLAAQLK